MEPRRLLVTGCPAYGHLLPMLPLVRAAERAGHEVRLATGPDMVAAMERRGLRVLAAGLSFPEMWASHDAALVGLEEAPPMEQAIAGGTGLFGATAPARLRDLEDLCRDWRPDLVVHETLELAGPVLARRLGVPSVVHGFGPMFPMYAFIGAQIGPAAGQPDLWDHLSTTTCLDICPPSLQPDGPPPYAATLPLRPSAGEASAAPVPEAVAALLASSRPLAYFTLGTVTNAAEGELATGVAALRELDMNLVVTTGPGVDPADLGDLPPHVAVAEFVPQAVLLARADLLVSQCGAGTLLGALCHGVPQVCLPRGTDQPQNAACVAAAGAGVVVDTDDFAVDTIRAAAERVRDDPSYAAAARRIQGEIAEMPSPDAVLETVLTRVSA